MSRLSALKEFSFMKVLRENGFRVPEPVAQSRHTVVMELVDAFPLRQISSLPDPAGLYAELIAIIMRLASFGLIHGDFNEFNILIREDETVQKPKNQNDETSKDETSNPPPTLTPILIDFPQMLSIDHLNAEMYFDRDVNCIKRFFERRYNFVSNEPGPSFADARQLAAAGGKKGAKRLDVEVEASGFSRKMAKELEKYMQAVGVDGDGGGGEDQRGSDDDDLAGSGDSDDSSDESPVVEGSLEDAKGLEDSFTANRETQRRLPNQEIEESRSGIDGLSIEAVG